jgi:hypothetical protein
MFPGQQQFKSSGGLVSHRQAVHKLWLEAEHV